LSTTPHKAQQPHNNTWNKCFDFNSTLSTSSPRPFAFLLSYDFWCGEEALGTRL